MSKMNMDQLLVKTKMNRFPRSEVWDETTRQVIDAVRAFIHRHPQPTISSIQDESTRERPLKGPFHLVRDTLPAPAEDDVRQLLFSTISDLGEVTYEPPNQVSIPVEWIGRQAVAGGNRSAVASSKCDDLECLTKGCTTDLTILHVHGGAFFQGSPESYRSTTSTLASLSGGRVVSVKYRLSPQHPFPAAILDVLTAYLSLLYAPSSSAHRPVDPSHIVFAGDSAGGVLLCCVLQTLLRTASHAPIRFHAHTILFPIPPPSGIAILSLPGDLNQSLPSYEACRVNDLFLELPWSRSDYPSCDIWPTNPPRPDIYCLPRSFLHPFVSLALVKSWAGAPPMWLACGDEQFVDGGKAVARRAALQGVDVTWTQFEAMPHCFVALPRLSRSRQAEMLMVKWAAFCRKCANGALIGQGSVNASRVSFNGALEKSVELEDPRDPSFEDVDRMIHARVKSVERLFEEEWKDKIPAKL